MSSKRRICDFHTTPSGCRHGAACRFLHAGPPGAAKLPPPPTKPKPPTATSRSGIPPPNHSASRPRGLPPNACAEFWTKGKCDRIFECRFRHLRPTDHQDQAVGRRGASLSLPPPQTNALGGNSTASDILSLTSQSLTPSEAHNHLKLFLRDGYQFRTPRNMHSFAAVLGSANSESNVWQLSEGQSFLSLIAKAGGNGVRLMGMILSHGNVSTQAQSAADVLSFQQGYLPLFTYLSSDFVIKSTMNHDVISLYSIVDINFDRIAEVVAQCLGEFTDAWSFADPLGSPTLPGARIFRSITITLTEYITRYKRAVVTHPEVRRVVEKVSDSFKIWDQKVHQGEWKDPIEDLPAGEMEFIIRRLRQGINTLVEIVDLAEGRTIRQRPQLMTNQIRQNQGLITRLELTYVGPGHERPEGPRHDNDHADISEIKIAPTYQELICDEDPYLPSNIPGARHHLPSDSMARLVDIQFRLLREELIAPVKSSINLILEDLRAKPTTKTQLGDIFQKNGGMYTASKHSLDAVRFQVYTNVGFGGMHCDQRHGLAIGLSMDSPNGGARRREASKRQEYWRNEGKKRLNQGALVAMVWGSSSDPSDVGIYLGVVSSFPDFLEKSAAESQDRIRIQVAFFDKQVEFRIFQQLQQRTVGGRDLRFLIEAPVMLESLRPFLETLQRTTPSLVPFSRYLAHPNSGSLKDVPREPPLYATRPGFLMDLSSLFPKGSQGFFLRPTDSDSVQAAREALKERTTLDPSQADAIVDSLTSEISLIQGPPGTGKSYTGVELIRVLLANKVKPIILIAFTNHALDNLLLDVVKAEITRKIVRIGSRSKDEAMDQFSLGGILARRSKERSQARKAEGAAFRVLKETEESMRALMERTQGKQVKAGEMQSYLTIHYPDHLQEVIQPPLWVTKVFEDEETWSGAAKSFLDFWRLAKDLDFISPSAPIRAAMDQSGKAFDPKSSRNKFSALLEQEGTTDDETPEDANTQPFSIEQFFRDLDYITVPRVPSTDRPVSLLQQDPDMWRMSRQERKNLFKSWTEEVRSAAYEKQANEFSTLRGKHAEMRTHHESALDQIKLDVLQNADLIGCTTNGAAKLTTLLKSLQPKILLVEEAGQVLEAHILASLVPSVESMVLIGDPQQLRPNLANYHLSVDNPHTGKIYQFDRSLMERLSSTGYHMSQLEVQRRMRPQISHLIRKTLYPKLEDHSQVQNYPNVRGLAKNVFFLTHEHAEKGGGEDSVSKTNDFEVGMVKDLVMHLLRQGPYSGEKSIVVLCAYLGQLAKINKELSGLVTTVIDQRDQDQLVALAGTPDVAESLNQTMVARHAVTKRVFIRTVDNFQGEEADIIILSLVRNSGSKGTGKAAIGFLKSPNRSNVALSRARHGLFILGNAADLAAQSGMWRTVVDELRQKDCIGDGFPISCSQHPGNPIAINNPGMIVRFAPDGGCLLPCKTQLRCGHSCPQKCHGDDPEHLSIQCNKDCQKLCSRFHPCPKRCAAPCGQCSFQMPYTPPSCGHQNLVQCHQLDSPQKIVCQHRVTKELPGCEHSAIMECGKDASQYVCQHRVKKDLPGCEHSAVMECGKDASQYVCQHRVNKELPGCEHFAVMACGKNASQYVCNSRCNSPLPCCGDLCASRCGSCQKLNSQPADGRNVPRQIHVQHPCGKPLDCQHLCNHDCSTKHDCSSTICQGPCHQNCSHRICNRPCAEPCPPCVEPVCDWQCDHFKCPVACGSVCARLPCDKRCKNTLNCGHRCPSICGEDCGTQVCPKCASPQMQSLVVDMAMGITMSEVDLNGEELKDILVTLTCQHVFTVEFLDRTCRLSDYYAQGDGLWTGLAEPPEGLKKPPVCPTCRGPISARRYGRVFKRARLDMLEQHSADSARQAIHEAFELRARFDLSAARATSASIKLSLRDMREVHDSSPDESPSTQSLLPLSATDLGENIGKQFLLPRSLTACWLQVVEPLLQAYAEACRTANLHSPNYTAYKAAFTTLYHIHHDNLPKAAFGYFPEDVAQEQARIGCGQAPPRAEMRVSVEAIWASVDIRFDLIKAARVFLENLKAKKEGGRKAPDAVLRNWARFILFIHDSSCNDCYIAIRLAKESNSHRQVVRSTLLLLRTQFERFRDQSKQHLTTTANRPHFRNKLANKALAYGLDAKRVAAETAKTYRTAVSGALAQQEWLQGEFSSVADVIANQWSEQAYKLRRDPFYEPIELGEMAQIVQAFSTRFHGFSTRGHWYACPQGHVYVNSECGDATKGSFCPECGAAIGSSNYQQDAQPK